MVNPLAYRGKRGINMTAYILTGGSVWLKNLKTTPEKGDIVIAADSGFKNARALDLTVDVLIGDMDSLNQVPETGNMEIIRLPEEKDVTDTQAAVAVALERGADNICIIGGIGSRIDHTLSSLAILEDIEGLYSAPLGKRRKFFGINKQMKLARQVNATLTNGFNRVRFLRDSSAIIPKNPYFRYLSIICVEEEAKGVCVDGVKYPLQNAKLSRRHQYAVSNEIVGNCAFVAVQKGALYVIESYDDRFEV